MSDPVAAPSAADLVGALAEPDRLSVLAALVLGAGTALEIAASTGLAGRDIDAALRRLRGCGLVSVAGELVAPHPELFKAAARATAASAPHEFAGVPDGGTLRLFLRHGRLLDLPADLPRRRIVLRHVATTSFEPGARYPESEVNIRLDGWGADHATLRRYLVDHNLMHREAGEYWLDQ